MNVRFKTEGELLLAISLFLQEGGVTVQGEEDSFIAIRVVNKEGRPYLIQMLVKEGVVPTEELPVFGLGFQLMKATGFPNLT